MRQPKHYQCTLTKTLSTRFNQNTTNILWPKYTIWAGAWDFQQCGMCDHQSLRSACAYAQSDQSLCLSLEYSTSVKLLTEHHLVVLRLKGGCIGLCESRLVKMPHCLKSHVTAQILVTKNSTLHKHIVYTPTADYVIFFIRYPIF